jgi:hypothetical protein
MDIKKKTVAAKNYVVKHRAKIAVSVTSAMWLALMVNVAEQHNEFLKEHGLFEEFYQFDTEE